MYLRACNAAIGDVEERIRVAVRDMLAACDVYDPPTPLKDLLEYRHLTAEQRDALVPSRLRYLARKAGRRLLRKIAEKVSGILDLRARVVLIDRQMHPRRREFLQYHEIGHDVLPWHRELFVVTSEWDLSPTIHSRFEAEANSFAANAIFQVDDLARVQRGRRLEMSKLAALAARYGASLTATARHYVSVQDLPVALVVGKPVGAKGRRGIRFVYGVANASFIREFGNNVLDAQVRAGHPMASSVNGGSNSVVEFEFLMEDRRGEQRRLLAETLFNCYDTLTLVHPLPGARRSFGWLIGRLGGGISN